MSLAPLTLGQAAPLDYQAPPVDNPMKGLVPYPSSAAANRFPHTLEFGYLALNEVLTGQTTEGDYVFDWSSVETFLNAAKGRGNQGIFRIFSEYPGRGLSVPQFLIDGGLTVSELPYGNTTSWTPDYENAQFREALQGTIAALGAAYDGDVRIGFLELGLIGTWGEWHNFGQDAYNASATTRQLVLQAYEDAFETSKLLVRYPRGGTGEESNVSRAVGYHDDSFTWSTLPAQPWHFMSLMAEAGALEKWKTEPIGGELFPQLNDCVFEDGCSHDGTLASDFKETVEQTHASFMRLEGLFKNGVSEERRARAEAAVRRMGYDLHFNEAAITPAANGFTIDATLENRGVAPFYYHWPITVGLLDADGTTIEEWPVDWRIDGLLPDSERQFNQNFSPTAPPPIGAKVALRLPNLMVGGRPLRFSNVNQQMDGQAWMILGGADGSPPEAAPKKVLFIRGGDGTVGFFEGGSDEQGADVFNYSTNGGNHGWGELNAALVAEGFEVEQLAENPVSGGVPTPIPFESMNLDPYSIIVFGSNNASYTAAQVDAVMNYIDDGGAALFVSDANFGQNWGDAPSSDQHFLDRFGLTMNQDAGTYDIRRANEFEVPTHPILNGVDLFDGEGVSPITRGTPPSGVTSTLVTLARNSVRRNTGASQGPTEPATAMDGSLVVATFGAGRIAGHYDRNTFFNDNGAGTNINRFDNEVYARNLFNWLAGNATTTSNYTPRGHFPNLIPGSMVSQSGFATKVVAKDPDGRVVSVSLAVDGALISTDTTAPYEFAVPELSAGTRVLMATVTDNQGAATEVSLVLEVTDTSSVAQVIDRRGWDLSATNNSNDVGNAIDGDISSRWATQEPQQAGQKFTIDLGQRELFQRIVLETPNNPDDYPRGYVVRGSDDGSSFTEIATGNGAGPTTDILLAAPVTYRYVEIEQTGSASFNWWSIHEINLLRPPADSVLPLASWLQFHFGSTPPSLMSDDDGDGLTLLEEYAYNSSPVAGSDAAVPAAVVRVDPNDAGSVVIDLTYRRWRIASESSVVYAIHVSHDLAGWTPDGLDLQILPNPIANGDGTETVTTRIRLAGSVARQFVRLELSEG